MSNGWRKRKGEEINKNLVDFAYIGGSQHILRVDECPEQTHQLDSSPQLWVRVTNHLLNHNIYQENILKHKYTKQTKEKLTQ